jgi:hypothetical protein
MIPGENGEFDIAITNPLWGALPLPLLFPCPLPRLVIRTPPRARAQKSVAKVQ